MTSGSERARVVGPRNGAGVLAMLAALTAGACHGDRRPGVDAERLRVAAAAAAAAASPNATAAQIIAAAQTQAGSPVQPAVAQSFKTVTGGLQPKFAAAAAGTKLANVVLPQIASGAMHLQDAASGTAVDVSLPAAQAVAAQTVGGYVVYPSALGAAAAMLHRALPDGSEDFVYMSNRPATAELDYSVSLGAGVAGLRLVGGVLEFLDAAGTPQLHVSPPWIVSADGTPTDGALAVNGCAVDSDPSPPWGRPVTAPGATSCTVKVTWPDTSVTYPAILDPRWTTTGSMATARIEHTLILLSTGKALAAGGRSSTSSTTGLASAELYDRTSGTWAATGSLAHGRRLHSATQLGSSSNGTTSGKILVAGGISGTTSMNTAELYSPTAGTWSAAGTMDVVRHGHTATLLADGRVLAAGGLNGTTTLTSASLYNPASGAGSWVATTGPIPPPGLKNHTATLIQTTNNQLNNHVLFVGGNNGTSTIAAVYLFDPVQNAFSTLASISSPREQHTAMTLQNTNGKILIAGGKNGSTVLSSAIVFDPSASNGTWSSAGTMTTARVGHTMTLLPNTLVANGQVLVAGGSSDGTNVLSSAELFSGTSTWTATPSLPGPLEGQQAVLLTGNMILNAGGLSSSTTVQNAAYLYDASFGLACTSNSQCASGFCANGVCCDTACNGGTCGACNLAGHVGTCTMQPSGTVCRAAAGSCDVAETCSGSSFACPADGFQPLGSVCRSAAGECDLPETCSGTSAACPTDSKKAANTACTDDGNPCTADRCDGTNVTCQHPAGNPGAVCRAAAGSCDVAETCTGTSTTCPADAFKPASTVCRAQNGSCDVAETCPGNSASCPADAHVADGTTCNDGNACTQTDTCQSGVCAGTNPVSCPPPGQCQVATCDPSSAACGAAPAPDGTTCDDGNPATQGETCQTGVCDPNFTIVPSLVGIAVEGAATKAIFTYTTGVSAGVTIPYGTTNGLFDSSSGLPGTLIPSPSQQPPTYFQAGAHDPFVVTIPGTQITWTVQGRSVTANAASSQTPHLPVTAVGDGTYYALLPDGTKLNLDATPPADPVAAKEPGVGAAFNGVLTGQLSITPSGAASYTLPISVPPGVAGMAPNLALAYNSQGPDGLLGQGWSLTGLSVIERCPKTLVQDGITRPVQMDDRTNPNNTDGICLDDQRLFETYPGSNQFRPERADYSQISFMPDGSFHVTLKSGETRIYGMSSDDRVLAAGPASNGTANVAAWLLDRVVDAWGNYMDVKYTDTAATFADGGVQVSEIDYTGHLNSSGAVDVQPFYQVTFQYQSRPDHRPVRFGSTAIPRNSRLTEITTPRGSYILTYEKDVNVPVGFSDPTLPSRLHSVQYCTPNTGCLPEMDFTWQGGGYGWTKSDGYALPSTFVQDGSGMTGSAFVDVDGDGLRDFILARPSVNQIYRNNGKGWEPMIGNGSTLPVLMARTNTQAGPPLLPTGVRFADMDGDGMPDLVQDHAQVTVNGSTGYYSPAVWLNKFRQGNGWEFHGEYGHNNYQFDFTRPLEMLADMDGDGLNDIVIAADPQYAFQSVYVYLNRVQKTGSWLLQQNYLAASPTLRDVNRDGLPDLVVETDCLAPGNMYTATATQTVIMNLGTRASLSGCYGGLNSINATPPNGICYAAPVTYGSCSGSTVVAANHPPQFADIDGDGFYDEVVYYPKSTNSLITDPNNYVQAVGLGNGTGTGYQPENLQTSFWSALYNFSARLPPDGSEVPIEDFGYSLLDINGDGLADLVRNHVHTPGGPNENSGGGEVLFSNGYTWVDPDAISGWQVSPGPRPIPVGLGGPTSAIVDLNGDGIPDAIETSDTNTSFGAGSFINTFQPPIITDFPNGMAFASHVEYHFITEGPGHGPVNNGFYTDDVSTEGAANFLIMPLRVATVVTKEDASGTGAMVSTGYFYHSLRISPEGRGPLGFRQIDIRDQASSTLTVTTYAQAFPYTGLPVKIERYDLVPNNALLASRTQTDYCDTITVDSSGNPNCTLPGSTYPPQTSLFIYPMFVRDLVNLNPDDQNLTKTITTTTQYRYDKYGNPTTTTVGIGKISGGSLEEHFSETDLVFGAAESDEQKQGKITQKTTTLSYKGATKTHVNSYEYAPVSTLGGLSATALALTKERLSIESGWPVELDTAYAYDSFGNIVTTTKCANDFTDCAAGADGPIGSSDPVHHAPFRTTSVSYNPEDFAVPIYTGVLNYGNGRFPVRTTNAAQQVEYTLYDALQAEVVQHTDLNNISTCYSYDDLGRMRQEVDRCGTTARFSTTIDYFLTLPTSSICIDPGCVPGPSAFSPPNSRIVKVTRPPNGLTTWSYSDDQAKATGALAYSFDGGFVETRSAYNALGQVVQLTKPFHIATSDDPTPPSAFTTTIYDLFNRPFKVIDDLGVIDPSKPAATTTVTTTYDGTTVQTKRTVNGVDEIKLEDKNVMGKVSQVTDANGGVMKYTYDADGNLTGTSDPAQNPVTMGYDGRGRRTFITDPDSGTITTTINGFGDLVQQTDATTVLTTTMLYDNLGRMIRKLDPVAGASQWVYDVAPGAGKGRLAAVVGAPDPTVLGTCSIPYVNLTDAHRAGSSFVYNNFGDLQAAYECVDGATFATSYEYDYLGRQSIVRYPNVGNSQLAVGYHYTSLGTLQYLTDESSDRSVLWQVKTTNALGQVTDEIMRNGVETAADRNAVTGWLMNTTSTAHADGNTMIQSRGYAYDEVGNLLQRTRSDSISPPSAAETFVYDVLNRLKSSAVTSGSVETSNSYDYDAIGNITQKDGRTYTYNSGCLAGDSRAAGPHAVCTVGGGPQFSYDVNGNVTNDGTRSLTYDLRRRVLSIQNLNGTGNVAFAYGATGNRVVQVATNGSQSVRTEYVGLGSTGKSMYERTITTSSNGSQSTKHVYFVYAGTAHGGNAFALRVLADDGTVIDNQYLNFDHLGSVTAMSDDTGHIAQATGPDASVFDYDAWGARRNPDGSAATVPFNLPVGAREFTGHETIPDVGLINMNGRVYDPVIARFLSPDATVQDPNESQNFNRYSYVLNNPLRYTDPTGYSWLGIDWGSGMTWLGIGEALLGAAVCAAAPGVGCIATELMFVLTNTAVSIGSGVGAEQAIFSAAGSINMGIVMGGLSGGVSSALGGGFWATTISGAVSGAISTAMSDAGSGQGLGWNIALSALQGGAASGVAWAVQSIAPVTQATGSSGRQSGSGSSVAESRATGTAAGRAGWIASELVSSDDDDISEVGFGDAYNQRKARLARLTPAEKALKQANPVKFLSVELDAYTAVQVTKQLFSPVQMQNGGPGNAFQHAYWSALMTVDVGPEFAAAEGFAHENYGPGAIVSPDEQYDSWMDLKNNAVGRAIGSEFNDEWSASANGATTLQGAVMDALRNGRLFWRINVAPYYCTPICIEL